MKLILAIVQDTASDSVTQALTNSEFRVTRIASTGGLLHHGVVTLLIGVKDDKVETAIQVMRENIPEPAEPGEKRATVFVVAVDQYVQI